MCWGGGGGGERGNRGAWICHRDCINVLSNSNRVCCKRTRSNRTISRLTYMTGLTTRMCDLSHVLALVYSSPIVSKACDR